MRIKKRLTALFLSVATILSCTPFTTMAEDDEWGAEALFGTPIKKYCDLFHRQ